MKSESIYFQALINEVDFPFLHDFLKREYVGDNKVRGFAKKYVCQAAEDRLKQQEREQEDTQEREQEHAELIQRLDEIRHLLRSGVRVPSETVEELKQESSRVKDSLRALMA